MKRLMVDINEEEYQLLKEIAANQESSVALLLGAFVHDLTASDRSGGSDERMYARDWLYRASLKYR